MAPYSPIQKALGGKPYDYSATDAASQEQAYNRAKTRQTVNANKALAKAKKIPVKAHTRTVRVKPPKSNGGAPSPSATPQGGLDATTRNLIEAAVRLKFGGQDASLNQQLQGAARFASGVPAWYSQAIQQIQGQQVAPAPMQAITPPSTGDPAQDSRNQLLAMQNNQIAGRQANQNNFLTNVGAGLQVQQGNVLAGNAQQQNAIRQQQAQLAGQKGDFRTTMLADQQAAQSKADIENKKIQASLLIAQGKTDMAMKVLESLNQDRNAKNKIAAKNAATAQMKANRSYQLDLKKFGRATAKDNYQREHGLGPYKSGGSGGGSSGTYSKSKLQAFDEKWNYASATAVQLFHKGSYTDKRTKKTQPISVDVAYGALLGQVKDPDIAKAAAYKAFGKQLPPDLVHRLAVKGIHVGSIKIKPSVGGGPYGTGTMP